MELISHDIKILPAQVDYFFDIAEKDPKYIANVDKNGYGLLHVSTRRLRSRKLFSWGNNQGSDNWQQFLTENAGRYVEIQAGIGKTQYGCIPMPPHSAWEWMEQYSAIQLDSHFNELSFEELRNELTNYVKDKYCPDELEKVLQQRKKPHYVQESWFIAEVDMVLLNNIVEKLRMIDRCQNILIMEK